MPELAFHPSPVARSPRDGGRAHVRRAAPIVVATALAAASVVVAPMSLDLAAAEYRAALFGREGFSLWDLQWYAGHHMPGYSVTVPALSWLIGPRLLGAVSAVLATALFERLAWRRFGRRAWLGSIWFAAGLVPALASLVALNAALDANRSRTAAGAAVALAVLTAATSPVAALALAVAGAAVTVAQRRPLAGVVGAAALGTIVALAIVAPEGGTEPFAWNSFVDAIWFVSLGLVVAPRSARTVRAGLFLYALGLVAAFVVPTPVGANAARLGALFAGPVLALVLIGRDRRSVLALAVLALPLVAWQWSSAVGDLSAVRGDPTTRAAYYRPLLRELDAVTAKDPTAVGGRLEIPFTRLHWEARWVAPRYALARGWERQVDRGDNPLFYGAALTRARYRAWLRREAVRWVALPSTRPDYSARSEVRLIRSGLPYLREVWHDDRWRLYAVRSATGLADGPARVTSVSPDAIVLRAARPGRVNLRVRWTPYWSITGGDACVARNGAWTRLDVRRAGTIRVGVRFSLARIGAGSARCGDAR